MRSVVAAVITVATVVVVPPAVVMAAVPAVVATVISVVVDLLYAAVVLRDRLRQRCGRNQRTRLRSRGERRTGHQSEQARAGNHGSIHHVLPGSPYRHAPTSHASIRSCARCAMT